MSTSSAGSTRWSRIATDGSGSAKIMWLVPARPGARVDWAEDAWLDALDDATAPRILRPVGSPPCADYPYATSSERVETYTSSSTFVGGKGLPSAITAHGSESSLREQLTLRGFTIASELAPKITSLYGAGWTLIALEMDSGASPTLRVSDDSTEAALPFALAGEAAIETRATVWTFTSGAATVAGARDVNTSFLSWGKGGSDYATHRGYALQQGLESAWARESSSHAAVFDGTSVSLSISRQASTPAAASTFYGKVATTAAMAAACTSSASNAVRSGVVARVCGAGSVLRVGGGTCSFVAGPIDPAAFRCATADDLGLALGGLDPTTTYITRFAGRIPATAFGTNVALGTASTPLPPIASAGSFERCSDPRAPAAPPPPPPTTEGSSGGGLATPPATVVETPAFVTHSESCGGGDVYVEDDSGYYEDDDGCSGSSSSAASSSSSDDDDDGSEDSEGSSSDSSDTDSNSEDSSSDDSDDGLFSSSGDDDSDWSSDSDSDSDSDSSSDACSGSTSSSSSTSGDSEMKPSSKQHELRPTSKKVLEGGKKPAIGSKKHVKKTKPGTPGKSRHGKHGKRGKHAKHAKHARGKSPVSRMALFLGALVLPFRRRGRRHGDDDSSASTNLK